VLNRKLELVHIIRLLLPQVAVLAQVLELLLLPVARPLRGEPVGFFTLERLYVLQGP